MTVATSGARCGKCLVKGVTVVKRPHKRIVGLLMLVAALPMLVVACGGSDESADSTTTSVTEATDEAITTTASVPEEPDEATTTTEVATTAAPAGIRATTQNVESRIGEEATFCGGADAITQRGDGLQTVFMGALLVYIEPDAGMSSRWWEDDKGEDRDFCVTGTVQPADERGTAFITVTDRSQVE